MPPLKFTIETPEQVQAAEEQLRNAGKLKGNGTGSASGPRVLGVADLLALDTPAPSMLIENIVPERGASLIVGAAKTNKTLIAVQMAIAEASGNPFLENYEVLRPGPVLMVEQDDPAGAASIKEVLKRSPVNEIFDIRSRRKSR